MPIGGKQRPIALEKPPAWSRLTYGLSYEVMSLCRESVSPDPLQNISLCGLCVSSDPAMAGERVVNDFFNLNFKTINECTMLFRPYIVSIAPHAVYLIIAIPRIPGILKNATYQRPFYSRASNLCKKDFRLPRYRCMPYPFQQINPG